MARVALQSFDVVGLISCLPAFYDEIGTRLGLPADTDDLRWLRMTMRGGNRTTSECRGRVPLLAKPHAKSAPGTLLRRQAEAAYERFYATSRAALVQAVACDDVLYGDAVRRAVACDRAKAVTKGRRGQVKR